MKTVFYRDIDLSFAAHPVTGDVAVVEEAESVMQQLGVLIGTMPGSVPFHPQIGVGLQYLLFENWSQHVQRTLERALELAIKEQCRRVDSFRIITENDTNGITVRVLFKLRNGHREYEYKTVLKRVR